LPATGVVPPLGIEGVSAKPTALVVPPGVGQTPSPMRKKMNFWMLIVKSRFTAVLRGTLALVADVLESACAAGMAAARAARHAIAQDLT
jgi:hypothetical protein